MEEEPEKGNVYYLATVEAPSAVFHSVYANFLEKASHNLILSKVNYLEVYEIVENGLNAKLKIPLNGRITILKSIPSAEVNGQDMIFVCTEKERFCILKYDSTTLSVVTVSFGDVHDRACRPIERGQLVAMGKSAIILHLVQGLMKILFLDKKTGRRTFVNARIEELQVLDIGMLDDENVLVLLSENYNGGRMLTTYTMSSGKEKNLAEGPWNLEDLEMDSHMLISVPNPRGGVLVIADESIFYYNHGKKSQCALAMKPTRIVCHCQIDENGFRYLLADADGGLYVLMLFCQTDDQHFMVDSLKLEYLGKTVIASTLTYLDDGFVFVGSHFGDSQVIRLSKARLADGNFVEVIDQFKSLAPIVDFAMVDIEKIGQNSVVACSGAYKEGSIRVIRKGSNLSVDSFIPLTDWTSKELFSFQRGATLYLFTSDSFSTKILEVKSGGELSELDRFEPFILSEPSLLITQLGNTIIQVTPRQVSISSAAAADGEKRSWRPNETECFTTISTCGDNVLVASSKGKLTLFKLGDTSSPNLATTFETNLPRAGISSMCMVEYKGLLYAFIGVWNDDHPYILDVQKQTSYRVANVITRHPNALIRSMQVHNLEGKDYLFIGHGDGYLMIYRVEFVRGAAASIDLVPVNAGAILGNEPVKFNVATLGVVPRDQKFLFATSNRPFLITSVRGRISISLTNFKDTHSICGLNFDDATSRIAVAKEDGLYFCTLDADDRSSVHHQTHLMGETVTRIIHCPVARAYAIISNDHKAYEMIPSEHNDAHRKSRIQLIDQDNFMLLDTYVMPAREGANSLTLVYLLPQNAVAIIVGSAIQGMPGEEPQEGRILTFTISQNRKLSLLGQTAVPGCVYTVNALDGKLVATVNGMTCLYRWSRVEGETFFAWHHLHSHFGQILGVKASVRGNLVAVGDLMKSVNLLTTDSAGEKFTEVARDHEPHWMTEVHFIDDETILGADNLGNLFVLGRDTKTEKHFAANARWSLTVTAGFHLGEVVNKIAAGGLSRGGSQQNSNPLLTDQLLIGTTCGSIYQFGKLDGKQAKVLRAVQENLSHVISPIGMLDHKHWRWMMSERKGYSQVVPFIDGDLLARYLELPEKLQKVVAEGGSHGCPVTGFELTMVTRLVESLIATHQ